MPSFRTIFLLAAAGLASLTSAAPVAQGVSQVAQAVGIDNVANGIAQGVTVEGVDVTLVNLQHRQTLGGLGSAVQGVSLSGRDEDASGPLGSVVGGLGATVKGLGSTLAGVPVLGPLLKPISNGIVGGLGAGVQPGTISARATSLQSLPTILNDVQTQLHTLTTQLNTAVNGQTAVNVDVLKPIIASLKAVILNATASIKLLVGQPAAVILALNGKVLAAVDVAHILLSVLALVYGILATVLRVAAPAALPIVTPLVAAVGSVVANLLSIIIVELDVGIFAAIGPLLTSAIFNAWAAIKLNNVVAILKVGKN